MKTHFTEEQQHVEDRLVEQVVASFDDTKNPRLKEIVQSLTTHLHNFVREVRLTEAEWNTGIEFFTQVGTDDRRQESILLSDVLGVSMQTINVSNQTYKNATEATVFGPFFTEDAPEISIGGDISGGASSEPSWISGTVSDTEGNPIPTARIEVWEADDDGFYDVQYTDGRVAGRAHLYSNDNGHYNFWGLTPTPYPIPHDGPVGKILEATGRSPVRAANLHFMVTAPGYRTLGTHIFVVGDPQLDIGDSVFGVKESLIKVFEQQSADTPTPDGRQLSESWSKAQFDIVLAPEQTL